METFRPDTNYVKVIDHHFAFLHVQPQVEYVLSRPGYNSSLELRVNLANLLVIDVVISHRSWQIKGFLNIFWHVIALQARIFRDRTICNVLNGTIYCDIEGVKINLVLDIVFADKHSSIKVYLSFSIVVDYC